MKKALMLVGCIALFFVLFTGCKEQKKQAKEKVQIRWFVGLGAGTNAEAREAQDKVVAEFNRTHDDIELILEIVSSNQAYDNLATKLSAGDVPDVVGPVGMRGRDSFKGSWLDMAPLIKKHNYDMSKYSKEVVDFYRVGDDSLYGMPFAMYPSFLYVNKALFDEAGIPYPPQKFGEDYTDENGVTKPWDVETLREISMKLTVDENGLTANDEGFDIGNIVQFGFAQEWTDGRGAATLFGPDTLTDANNNARIPERWRKAFKWHYDAMWKDRFHPFGSYNQAAFLAQGDFFKSGRVAMVNIHLWYAGFAEIQQLDWDTAVVPGYEGKQTARLHADTFLIMKKSKHPDEAFKVLTYLLNSRDLINIYGGMPANKADQDEFFEKFAADKFPGKDINWDVVKDSQNYADNPSHEAYMPDLKRSFDRVDSFWNKIQNEDGLDMDAELDLLKSDLQDIFDAAKE